MNKQLSEKYITNLLSHEIGSDSDCEGTSEIKAENEDNSDCDFQWDSEEETALPEVRATRDFLETSKSNVSAKRSGGGRPAMIATPGPAKRCKLDMNSLYYFKLLITPSIIDIILYITNLEISQRRKKQLQALDKIQLDELEAYLGLLILAAAHNCNHLPSSDLFSHPALGSICQATMSVERFQMITDCLRFDFMRDMEVDDSKKVQTITSVVWDTFIKECQGCHVPSKNCIIVEKELGPTSCYPLVYGSNKFGMKMVKLCDADTNYMIDAMMFFGKKEFNKKSKFCAKKLISAMRHANCNLIMDTRFSDIQLVKKILEKDTTVLCTLRKGAPVAPLSNSINQDSSVVLSKDVIFTNLEHRNRQVTFASSRTHLQSLNSDEQKKEMINAYNNAMRSMAVNDQIYHKMNIYLKTDRWQTCLFFNMISLAVINSHILHNSKVGKEKTLSCFDFMIQLHKELTEEWLWKRLDAANLNNNIRLSIEELLKLNYNIDSVKGEKYGPRAYCYLCDYTKRRRTFKYCIKCSNPVCTAHQQKTCTEC